MSKSKHIPEEKTSIDPAFFDRFHKEPFSLAKFIHNSKEGTYFGRTKESWGKKIDGNNCGSRFGEFEKKIVSWNTARSVGDRCYSVQWNNGGQHF